MRCKAALQAPYAQDWQVVGRDAQFERVVGSWNHAARVQFLRRLLVGQFGTVFHECRQLYPCDRGLVYRPIAGGTERAECSRLTPGKLE
jgi:hypothetical protein